MPLRSSVAVFRADVNGGRLEPTDRKIRTEFSVAPHDAGGAQDGELVLAETSERRRLGLPQARVAERLAPWMRARRQPDRDLRPRHPHRVPGSGPGAGARCAPGAAGEREDLRPLPLVTIDGDDARDFDDAVFAEPDNDPKNPAAST